MRVHKVINRVYEGTVYYRWVLSIPPKQVRDVGWVDGQEVEALVRGSSLWVQPVARPPTRRGASSKRKLEDAVERLRVTRR